MTAYDLIAKQIGAVTQRDDTVANSTLTTSPTLILRANPNRVAYILVNLGSNDMYVWFDETVSSSKGFQIAANGGSLSLYMPQFALMPTFQVFGVSKSATTSVACFAQIII